jgi:hypothetical protein
LSGSNERFQINAIGRFLAFLSDTSLWPNVSAEVKLELHDDFEDGLVCQSVRLSKASRLRKCGRVDKALDPVSEVRLQERDVVVSIW